MPSGTLRRFLSTLSLRRATRAESGQRRSLDISIHALLAESDVYLALLNRAIHKFLSTLSLRRATKSDTATGFPLSFLSTLSLRRATPPVKSHGKERVFLSTLSLRRATIDLTFFDRPIYISIHALLAESDAQGFSTLHHILISIHALLAESDTGGQSCNSTLVHFYPRSPCGERPVLSDLSMA